MNGAACDRISEADGRVQRPPTSHHPPCDGGRTAMADTHCTTRLLRDHVMTEADLKRLWKYVTKTADCWLWTGATGKGLDTYGRFNLCGHTVRAHRLIYTILVGPIPEHLQLRHICDRPRCVNPAHLIPSTNADNAADMKAKGRGHGWKGDFTHCPNGHPYSGANLYLFRGYRQCRTCKRAWDRAQQLAKPLRPLQTCVVCGATIVPSEIAGRLPRFCPPCRRMSWKARQRVGEPTA